MDLAEYWFRPKKFEEDGRLYRWLGVVAFKRLLMRVVRRSPAQPGTVNSHVLGGRSLQHMREFEIMNKIYASYFPPDKRPARTCIGVTGLAKAARVEIDFIARRP